MTKPASPVMLFETNQTELNLKLRRKMHTVSECCLVPLDSHIKLHIHSISNLSNNTHGHILTNKLPTDKGLKTPNPISTYSYVPNLQAD